MLQSVTHFFSGKKLGSENRRWVEELQPVVLSYNITRHETTNKIPWEVFFGHTPLQFYYTPDETPFWELTPVQKETLITQNTVTTTWEDTYKFLQEKRAELTSSVHSRHLSRATQLIAKSEKELNAAKLSVGTKVKVRRELPNRHGAIRLRKKFDAPIREDLGTVREYSQSNRYLIEFPNGEKKYFSRRWLQPIVEKVADSTSSLAQTSSTLVSPEATPATVQGKSMLERL